MAGKRRSAGQRLAANAVPGPLLLIAEDDRDQRQLYGGFFLTQGFRVEVVRDGAEAYQRAVDLVPDVIVMDLTMPFLDGVEATRRLKTDRRTAHIPVIACTAHAFGAYVEHALEAGCDAYVVKPCTPSDLLHEVRQMLARVARHRRRHA